MSVALAPRARDRSHRILTLLGLAIILCTQAIVALRSTVVQTPFEDEALYVYVGHQMIAHILHGAALSEFPGSYLSGSPGLYPPLAALGDHFGGIDGARDVSLGFAMIATIAVCGIGTSLYGRTAGLIGAAAFVLCGSVIYLSYFATYDSCMMAFIALAAWVTVWSAQRNRFMWYPLVSILLVFAFYAKYAAAAYLPLIALLAIFCAPTAERVVVFRRTVVMALGALVLGFSILVLWGDSLRRGIVTTTITRRVLYPASKHILVDEIRGWVGLWLEIALIGALVTIIASRTLAAFAIVATLLLASVIGPLDQIRIGESTSLSKHVAFGMVFACPLIGGLFRLILQRWLMIVSIPLLAFTLFVFGQNGLTNSHTFLTGWPSDARLVPVLKTLVTAAGNRPILSDASSPERYALRGITTSEQWDDTYSFHYDHLVGIPAYRKAIDQSSFGVIYNFQSGSPNDLFVYTYLTHFGTPYRYVGSVARSRRGLSEGAWSLFVLKTIRLPANWAGPGVKLPIGQTEAYAATPNADRVVPK